MPPLHSDRCVGVFSHRMERKSIQLCPQTLTSLAHFEILDLHLLIRDTATMSRRRSWPNDQGERELPLFTREYIETRTHRVEKYSTLPLFTPESIETRTYHIENYSSTKRENGSINVIWKLIGVAFVLFGLVAGRIVDNKGYRYIEQLGIFQKVLGETKLFQPENSAEDDSLQSIPPPLDRNPVVSSDHFKIVEDLPPFVVQKPSEYEMAPLRWASNGKDVDQVARVVGLPPILTHEIEKFCVEIGLGKLFQWAASKSDLDIDQTIIVGSTNLKEGHEWSITRTGKDNDATNLHWFRANDEKSYEATVDVLHKGHFDYVLNTIASEFKPWGYMFAGMGFTVGSHSEELLIERGLPGAGKNLLKLVFPIHMPPHKTARLYVGNNEDKVIAPLDLNYHEGLLLSGDTVHGVADFDHRKEENFQILASIYIADIHSDNIHIISEDKNALFHFSGDTDWLFAQRARFWGGTNGGSFEFDRGRKPYQPKDKLHNCDDLAKRGLCHEPSTLKDDPELWDVRKFCPKSCGIFIDDETYFSTVPRLQRQPESNAIRI